MLTSPNLLFLRFSALASILRYRDNFWLKVVMVLWNAAIASHNIHGVWDKGLFSSSLLHHMKVVCEIVKALLCQHLWHRNWKTRRRKCHFLLYKCYELDSFIKLSMNTLLALDLFVFKLLEIFYGQRHWASERRCVFNLWAENNSKPFKRKSVMSLI